MSYKGEVVSADDAFSGKHAGESPKWYLSIIDNNIIDWFSIKYTGYPKLMTLITTQNKYNVQQSKYDS